jgi:hypothetical protein
LGKYQILIGPAKKTGVIQAIALTGHKILSPARTGSEPRNAGELQARRPRFFALRASRSTDPRTVAFDLARLTMRSHIAPALPNLMFIIYRFYPKIKILYPN